ncbi:MAG: recombinase family protein [Clostridiales bacterium]|nr:recombinase family protein [Clostridiales bacterium]
MSLPKVGLYLRLSREDEGEGDQSMSIANQKTFLLQYVRQQGWPVAGIYTDDGYTGTNFDRPAFQRLLGDIREKRIDLVVTKDLSRLGRDQIGTVYYYQCFFPAHGVRYVAVSEGFDTAAGHTSIALPFLAAANDFYTADISRKVRSALDARRRSGAFIGAFPPLGYRKDPEQRGKLLVDEERRWIVEEVFCRYLESGSVRGTARALSAAQVPTPARCRGEGERCRGLWSDTMVRRILTNSTYAGHLTQNRSEKASYKITRRIAHPPEEWTIVPHTHEAIIPQARFDRVQELLRLRSYRPPTGSAHLLTGLAFCAACGSPMSYVREGTRSYMVCQGYRRGRERCTSHRIREDAVLSALGERLRVLARQIDPAELAERTLPRSADGTAHRAELERAVQACRRRTGHLYRDQEEGVITRTEFQELLLENRRRRAELEHRLDAFPPVSGSDPEQWAERVRETLAFTPLTRPAVLALVDRVLVEEGKAVEIRFRFSLPEAGVVQKREICRPT